MKKTLLTVLSCALLSSLSAQYVINKANAPKPGDVYEAAVDTVPQVTKGGSGASQTWDFTDFDLDTAVFTNWSDAATSPDINDFPEADLFIDGMFAAYFDLTDNKFEWIGIAGDFGSGRASTRLSNPETIIPFPSTFNTSYKDTSAYQLTFPLVFDIDANTSIDSGRTTYKNQKNVIFDAWGTITTPLAVFPNSLRERAFTITENKFEAHVCVIVVPGFPKQCQWVDAGTLDPQFAGGIDTTVVYTWYNQALSNPVASVTYNGTETAVEEATFNNDPNYVGIKEVTKVSGIVYPNPAHDFFYLKGMADAISLTITDVTGKIVKSAAMDGKNSVDIADLQNGNYIVTIIAGKGVSTDKLTVIR
jgi:hypothetical protein